MKNSLKQKEGITLIALVITIIVLLIIAGVTIATLTGDNGLLTKAGEAKNASEIGEEKEIISLSVIQAQSENKQGTLEENKFNEALNQNSKEGNKASIIDADSTSFKVKFESNRYYEVNKNGNITEYEFKIAEQEPNKSSSNMGTMKYGIIEIEFLKGTGYKTTTTPNSPILKDGMNAVYWGKDESGELNTENPQENTYEMISTNTNFNTQNWYNYEIQDGVKDDKTSRWANAITADGSYYVWIPRYAYRIIYFKNAQYVNEYRSGTLTEEEALNKDYIVGYSDARGIVNSNGERPANVDSTTSVSVNDKFFRTHPVFDGNPNNGGWDRKIEGLWMMKYKASNIGATATSEGTYSGIPMSVPNVKLSKPFNVARVFNITVGAYPNLNSHLTKNSEWGATAYLAESSYGRNGTRISINQCTDNITGTGRGIGENPISNSTYTLSEIDDSQKYDGNIGQLSSSTGNIYGIYDLCAVEADLLMALYCDDKGNFYAGGSSGQNTGFNGPLGNGENKTDGIDLPERKYYQLYNSRNTGTTLGDGLFETANWGSGANPTWNPWWCTGMMGGPNGIFSQGVGFGYNMGGLSYRMCLIITK